MNFMFDNCAFDHLLEYTSDFVDFFERTSKENRYYTTSIQIEEIAQIGDDKKEIRIIKTLCLAAMRPLIVNTDFVFDDCRFGFFEFAPDEDTVFENIKGSSSKMTHDAMIGAAAKRAGCIVITDDAKLTKRLASENIPAMSTYEFYSKVN